MYAFDDAQLEGIWIDFALLLLLSLHMRIYKLSFNCQHIPFVKDIAKAIIKNEHSKNKMASLRRGQTVLTEEPKDTDADKQLDADTEKEYEDIKRECSASRWMLRVNFAKIMTQHIFVTTTISFLIVLNVSLVSIISLPIFLYMLYHSNHRAFVKNELDFLVKVSMYILVTDLLIQILMQTPFYNVIFGDPSGDDDGEKSWERVLSWIEAIGWRIIWDRRTGPSSELKTEAFLDYISKAAITCILLLQYQSNEKNDNSWKHWEDDVDEMYKLGDVKGKCMTYRFNNKKVQKIILNQRERQHREILVRQIEEAVSTFETRQDRKVKNPLLPSQSEADLEAANNKPAAFSAMLGKAFKKTYEDQAKEEQLVDTYVADHSKRLVEEMNYCSRQSQHLRQKYSNQILLCHDPKELKTYYNKTRRGLIRFNTELDLTMRQDLIEWRRGEAERKTEWEKLQISLKEE